MRNQKCDSIIFLDIDSTINYWDQPDEDSIVNPDIQYQKISIQCMRRVVDLSLRTNSGIVITSTWRRHSDSLMFILRTLYHKGSKDIILCGETDALEDMKPYNKTRADEIELWIKENQPKHFVILDDDINASNENLKNHFVHSNYKTGITSEDCIRAEKILREINN